MKKDINVYYVVDDIGNVACYYFGGILSFYLCKLHFKRLINKYPDKDWFFKCGSFGGLLERYEKEF